MLFSYILTFFCVLWVTITCAQPGTYIYYGAEQGLDNNHTYDLVQDKDGFIWITSNNGVYRFDGTHFRHFSIEDGLPDNEVPIISIDHYDRIWFYCFNGKVAYYQNGRFFNEKDVPILAKVRLHNFSSGLYKGQNDTYHILGTKDHYIYLKVSVDSIVDCRETSYKALVYWEDGRERYIYRGNVLYKNGQPVPGFNASFPKEMCDVYGDALYYIAAGGLFCFRDDKHYLVFPLKKHQQPWKLKVQSPEYFFINCRNDEVIEVQMRKGQFLSSKTFKNVYHPSSALVDRMGNIWISSLAGGLYYYPLNKRNFRVGNFSADWPGKIITCIQVCGTQIIAGFENGSVACFDNKLVLVKTLLTTPEPLSPVRYIHYDSMLKRLVVAGSGIHSWYANGKGVYRAQPVYNASKRKSFYKDAEAVARRIYLNDLRHIFQLDITSENLLPDTLFKSLTRKFALYPDTITQKLWYSDIDGLHWLYKGQSYSFTSPHSFLSQRIMDIKMLSAGYLLLTTESVGMAIIDTSGNMLQLIKPRQLHSRTISQTKLYGNQLWLAGEKGISVYQWDNIKFKPVLWINRNAGLLSDNVQSFCLDGNFLYVATTEGLQRLQMQALMQQTDKPRLFIHSIRDKMQVWSNFEETIVFSEKSKEISIECSALAFGNTMPVTFAYRFEGSNEFIEIPGPVSRYQ